MTDDEFWERADAQLDDDGDLRERHREQWDGDTVRP